MLFSGTVADLVPHGLNDTWVYAVTGPGSQTATETDQVFSVDASGHFVLDLQQGAVHKRDQYLDTGTQLLFTGEIDVGNDNLLTTCAPALLRLSVPVMAGQTLSTASTCTIHYPPPSLPGTISLTETATPLELFDQFTVAAGTFPNVVHIFGTRSYGNEKDDVYVAPGVGIIRRVQVQLIAGTTQTITTELTGGTVGGQPIGGP